MDPKRLEKLRLLILGNKDDTTIDDRLLALAEAVESRLFMLLAAAAARHGKEFDDDIPDALVWIVDELIIKRYNRIGSEGFQTEIIEGHHITFPKEDFEEYQMYIDDFYAEPEDLSGVRRPGRVVIY